MNSMKLSTKLGLAFAILVFLTMAVGGFCLGRMAAVHASADDLASNWLPSVKAVADLRMTANNVRRAEADHVMSLEAAEMAAIEKQIAELKTELQTRQSAYEKLISSPEERATYDEYRQRSAEYFAIHDKLLAISRGGEKTAQETRALFRGASRSAFNASTAQLGRLVDINVKGSETSAEHAAITYRGALIWTLALIGVALVLASVLGLLIVRNVKRVLGGEPADAAALAQRVADGDLSVPIDLQPGDEASLLAALKRMQDSLAGIVAQVRSNAEGVAVGAGQIAQGNNDLSSRTEEQAGALEQTAASMEELGTTVKQNADNACQANQLANGASSAAEDGGVAFNDMVATMKQIDESSRRIADIIGVIDGIAFQTNILALNAAVEAARAGEQGRGFAVVAAEVRTLAQRSAEAAKEIKSLIGVSTERVGRGTELVETVGQKMAEIVSSIRRVNDIMGEITSASREQSAGVTQIGQAITQMDQVTQQNAALVEQSAAAADSLNVQARKLVEAVVVFKLPPGAESSAAALAEQAVAAARAPTPVRKAASVAPAPKPAKPAAARHTTGTPAPPVAASAKTAAKQAVGEDWATF
jgi:methyl-accepting chemotaxis protein